jgi:hypothetical protein
MAPTNNGKSAFLIQLSGVGRGRRGRGRLVWREGASGRGDARYGDGDEDEDEDGWDESILGRKSRSTAGRGYGENEDDRCIGNCGAGSSRRACLCVCACAKEDKEDQDGEPGLRGSYMDDEPV